jgi:hypothetical protein
MKIRQFLKTLAARVMANHLHGAVLDVAGDR